MPEFMQLLAIVVPVCTIILVTGKQNVMIEQIHVLVNARLTEALNEIVTLKAIVRSMQERLDAK